MMEKLIEFYERKLQTKTNRLQRANEKGHVNLADILQAEKHLLEEIIEDLRGENEDFKEQINVNKKLNNIIQDLHQNVPGVTEHLTKAKINRP